MVSIDQLVKLTPSESDINRNLNINVIKKIAIGS